MNDAVQVWDSESLAVVKMISGQSIAERSICTAVYQDTLICGTESGFIKLFNLNTGVLLSMNRASSHYVSTLKLKGSLLISVNCLGEISKWNLKTPDKLVLAEDEFCTNASKNIPIKVKVRERCLDFNDKYVVTSFGQHILLLRFFLPSLANYQLLLAELTYFQLFSAIHPTIRLGKSCPA